MTTIYESQNNITTFSRNFLIAGTSAAISKTIFAPPERVKIISPSNQPPKFFQKHRYYHLQPSIYMRIIQEEGIISLWRHNIKNIMRYSPVQGLNFAFYDTYKKIFSPYSPNSGSLNNLASGAAAGVTTMLFFYPIDLARIKVVWDYKTKQYTGLFDCLVKTGKSEGIKGLYQNFALSVIGVGVYRACYFGGYDILKRAWFSDEQEVGFIYRFLVAHFVAISANFISYPFDTVKRRLEMEFRRKETRYNGAIDCCKKIYKDEGITRGFYKEASSSLIFRNASSAFVLALYDELQKMFADYSRNM